MTTLAIVGFAVGYFCFVFLAYAMLKMASDADDAAGY